jgi:D-alanyl-D-alanine dipeptidase
LRRATTWASATIITIAACAAPPLNRHRLQRLLMEAEGFVHYDQEWWRDTFDGSDPLRLTV